MHEISIAKDLINEIEKSSKGKIPKKIIIGVGKASGIDPKFLKHSFLEHIFPERNWSNVELILESEEPALYCNSCKREIKDLDSLSCPFCNSTDLEIISGNRTYIKEIQY
jgi:Zn finger protein HypA/HybF involved in hydrogenase expression